MLKSVTIHRQGPTQSNYPWETIPDMVLTLDPTVPGPSPYIIKSIDGLGPAPGIISKSGQGLYDGAYINHVKTAERNIVFQLGYRPDYVGNQSVEDLRRHLYKHFMPTNRVQMTFVTDTFDDSRPVRIDGVVETVEPTIFSKDPSLQVSILCGDPFFSRSVLGTSLTPASSTQVSIEGDVSVGASMRFYLKPAVTLSSILVTMASSQGSIRIYPPSDGFSSLGSFAFDNTDRARARVSIYRTAVPTPWYDYTLSGTSGWPTFWPGLNRIQLASNVVDALEEIHFTYTAKYGGL